VPEVLGCDYCCRSEPRK